MPVTRRVSTKRQLRRVRDVRLLGKREREAIAKSSSIMNCLKVTESKDVLLELKQEGRTQNTPDLIAEREGVIERISTFWLSRAPQIQSDRVELSIEASMT